MATIRSFTYDVDNHKENQVAHKYPAVGAIVALILENPALLNDLEELLLLTVGVVPPESPPISEDFRDSRGGELTPEQERLGELIDDLYETTDLNVLSARRGALFERLILEIQNLTLVDFSTDFTVLNAKNIRLWSSQRMPINGYSVDVATWLAYNATAKFFACKLRAAYVDANELEGLTELATTFMRHGRSVVAAFCCLQSRTTFRPADMERFKRYGQVVPIPMEAIARFLITIRQNPTQTSTS